MNRNRQRLRNLIGDMAMTISREIVENYSVPDKCKFCGSRRIVRYGHYQKRQRWFCKDCKRKFADNDAPPNMKTPTIQIASALSMFYEGMSLNAIRRHLEQMYHNYPSDSTVYGWIVKYTKVAVAKAKGVKVVVGDVWIADETVLKISGRNMWFWDIIDRRTRFLLASYLSTTRGTRDARTLMERARVRAKKTPKVVITDRLASYLDGIELTFGAHTKHIASKGFEIQPNTNIIERFHGSLKARTKVLRGLKKRETAKLLLDGWLVHYNFFRPHESLGNKTPAEKAGVKFPYKNWLDVVKGGN